MLLKPDEVLKMINQGDELLTPSLLTEEPKGGRFKRLIPVFGSKDKNSKEHESKSYCDDDDVSTRQPFSSFFDNKSSLFSKKLPRSGVTSPVDNKTTNSEENEWTIVEIS